LLQQQSAAQRPHTTPPTTLPASSQQADWRAKTVLYVHHAHDM
jgi:hypothetical protein